MTAPVLGSLQGRGGVFTASTPISHFLTCARLLHIFPAGSLSVSTPKFLYYAMAFDDEYKSSIHYHPPPKMEGLISFPSQVEPCYPQSSPGNDGGYNS